MNIPGASLSSLQVAPATSAHVAETGLNFEWFAWVFLGALVLLMIAERFSARGSSQKRAKLRSYKTNLANFFFNEIALSILQLTALYAIAANWTHRGLLSGLQPGWAKVAIALVLLDLTLYGWHWACHHSNVLWIFHRVHHSDEAMNVTTGLRYSPGELVLEVAVRAAFVVITGISAEELLVCQGLMSLFVLFHHANIQLPGDRWIRLLFVTPSLHRAHHSTLRSEHDSNYGAVLSLWDRLFGSLLVREPRAFGLVECPESGFPGILLQGLPQIHIDQPVLARIPVKTVQVDVRRSDRAEQPAGRNDA